MAAAACVLFGVTARAQEPQPDVRALAPGERVERKVRSQEVHVYTIQLRRGQVLRAEINEKGADVGAAFVRAADNQKVSAAANFGSGFMRESLTLIPEQDGTYALVIKAQQVTDGNAVGGYELVTSLSDAATEKDQQRLQAERLLEEGMLLFVSDDRQSQLLAAAKWEASAALWRSLGERYWEVMASADVGLAHVKTENFGKAVPYLEAALAYFEGERYEAEAGAMSMSLGMLYMYMLDIEKATTHLNKALTTFKSLGDQRAEAQVLNLLNVVGETKGPADYEDEILKAQARKDKYTEAAIWEKAIAGYALDDSIDADKRRAFFERAAREAIPLTRELGHTELEMQCLVALGFGYADLAAEDEDAAAAEKADKAKSFDYFLQGLWLSEVTSNKQMQANVYLGMEMYYDDDIDRLAVFFGKKALNAFQDLRQSLTNTDKEIQQNYVKKAEEFYSEIAGELFSEGRLAEVQQVINFSRDQEYFDFTQKQGQPPAHLVLTTREAENEQILNREIGRIAGKYAGRQESDYRQATDELKAAFERLENNFRAPASDADINRNVPDTTDLQAALRGLDARSGARHVALYFVTDVNEVLLVTPDNVRAFGAESSPEELSAALSKAPGRVPEGQPGASPSGLAGVGTDELILKFLVTLKSPDSDPRPLGSLIYKRIFKTKELINGKTSATTLEAALTQYRPDVLLWSLSGNIRYVPMAALYDDEKRQYLIEKYQNAVFTRARKERFLTEPKPWTRNLAFGTSYARGSAPLPGVTKELTAIFGDPLSGRKGILNGRIFLNAAFTRQALLSTSQVKPSLVHIASHFSFQPGDSQNSFLLLGDGDRFSLYDIQQYPDLFGGVDLLTLSACETAAQQPGANGREIDGFAELAQGLGASSVIATLWKVDDEGTSQLMSEFYRLRLSRPDAPKSAILREAQLNLLNGKDVVSKGQPTQSARRADVIGTNDPKAGATFTPPRSAPFAHPYYWAPFVLFGSTR